MAKKSYMSLLKEAIAEFDTSDHLDVKGPMLDPILSWSGDGELPTNKDAASILERYYFNEGRDKGVRTLDEADYENDKGNPASGPAMKDAEGAGTSQAGTSDSGTIQGAKDEKEKLIAKEQEEVEDKDKEKEEDKKEDKKEDKDEDVAMENAIIEKLIAEMEAEDDKDEDKDKEEVEEMDMTYTGEGPKETMPDTKAATSPEQHATGAGTEQSGTGDAEGQIPDRKDLHDQMVDAKEYTDENTQIEEALAQLEQEMKDEDEKDEDEKELDVDKEIAKEAGGFGSIAGKGTKGGFGSIAGKPAGTKGGMGSIAGKPKPTKEASAVPGGPSPKKTGEDWEDDEKYYAEAFSIFKEAIREQEDEDEDTKKDKEDDKEKVNEVKGDEVTFKNKTGYGIDTKKYGEIKRKAIANPMQQGHVKPGVTTPKK